MKAKLTREEKELVKSIERGEWRRIPNLKSELQRYQRYAKEQLQKDQRVNIRLSSLDLHGVRRRAVEEGIPYQTLLSSIIHKYVMGGLIEKRA